jgi:hypothetical protein
MKGRPFDCGPSVAGRVVPRAPSGHATAREFAGKLFFR